METPAQTVTRLIAQGASRYPGGCRAVFLEINKMDGGSRSESTFYADFNANPTSLGSLKVKDMLAAMEITGDVAALRFIAGLFGFSLVSQRAIEPDAPTLDAEMLQDYPSVVEFHKAIKSGEDEIAVMAKLDAAILDLRQTFVMSRREGK